MQDPIAFNVVLFSETDFSNMSSDAYEIKMRLNANYDAVVGNDTRQFNSSLQHQIAMQVGISPSRINIIDMRRGR